VALRPIAVGDAAQWRSVRLRNEAWLRPWEATAPPAESERPPTFPTMVRRMRAEARAGRGLPFVITYDGRLVGQVTVGGIAYGSSRSGHLGYWVDRDHAGRGIVPTAVALTIDHCFDALRLHRMEISIRPENAASLRVVEKLGLRSEGLRERLLHIDGDWRDHVTFAVTAEEVAPHGLLARWRSTRPAPP
jgi:ribosomal-protein-alanine N-acetyltransferase